MIGSALFNGGKVDWRHVGGAVSCARHRGDLGSTPGPSGVMVSNPPFSPSLRVLAGKLRGNKPGNKPGVNFYRLTTALPNPQH